MFYSTHVLPCACIPRRAGQAHAPTRPSAGGVAVAGRQGAELGRVVWACVYGAEEEAGPQMITYRACVYGPMCRGAAWYVVRVAGRARSTGRPTHAAHACPNVIICPCRQGVACNHGQAGHAGRSMHGRMPAYMQRRRQGSTSPRTTQGRAYTCDLPGRARSRTHVLYT